MEKPLLVNEELATWRQLLPNVVVFKGRPRLEDVFKHVKLDAKHGTS